ncbi:MAG TPA: hypothetical protein VK569_10765 [Bacteroidota bacterium]|nr:hypothetical protein [Bacteroidota bacterium]
METPIPRWITVLSALIAAMGLFVGCSLYLTPGTFIPGIDFSSNGAGYLAQMWGARQIALAGIIAYSLLRRSSPMLRVSLLAYCIMNIQDAGIGLFKGDTGLLAGASVATILTGTIVFILARNEKSQRGRSGTERTPSSHL